MHYRAISSIRIYRAVKISRRLPRFIRSTGLILKTLCIVAALSACGTTPDRSSAQSFTGAGQQSITSYSATRSSSLITRGDALRKIKAQYRQWKGTPYLWGGTSERGLDCSGLVYLTFRDRFDIQLPRSTRTQQNMGRPVTLNQLKAGDLVFFKTGPNLGHVGIYLRDDEFLHVSTRRGVMISSLNNTYWKQRFTQARRVL